MTAADLVRFHTRHKLRLLAHSPEALRHLGRLAATAGGPERQRVVREYMARFRATIALDSRRERHVNALEHAAGHFQRVATTGERRALHTMIDAYRSGTVPLRAVTHLLRRYAEQYERRYLLAQSYLDAATQHDDD